MEKNQEIEKQLATPLHEPEIIKKIDAKGAVGYFDQKGARCEHYTQQLGSLFSVLIQEFQTLADLMFDYQLNKNDELSHLWKVLIEHAESRLNEISKAMDHEFGLISLDFVDTSYRKGRAVGVSVER